MDDLQLRGNLDPVLVGIDDEDEEIVAGAVAARSPHHLDVALGQTIGPVADRVPFARLVGMVVDALPVLVETSEVGARDCPA